MREGEEVSTERVLDKGIAQTLLIDHEDGVGKADAAEVVRAGCSLWSFVYCI